MPEINPLTNNQIFLKKIAENTGSDYETGDVSEINPLTIDQIFLKEIAANTDGQSGDITELEEKVTANTSAIEAITEVYGAKNLAPNNATNITESAYQFTVNSDKSITINKTGNMTQWGLITLAENFLLKAGNYFLSTGTSEYKSNAFLEIIIDGVNYGTNYGSDGTIDLELQSDKLVTLQACIFPNSTTFNVTLYPMIRDARITDPTYVPYAMTNRELTDVVTAHELGELINVSAYDSASSYFTCPSDGYTYLYDANSKMRVIKKDGQRPVLLKNLSGGEISLFVRKGMKIFFEDAENAYFHQLE